MATAWLRAGLLLLAAAAASASTVEAPRRRGLRQSSRRSPGLLAYQSSPTIYELEPDMYKGGKPYLLQFRGKGDDYCAQMEPLKEQLCKELGVEVRLKSPAPRLRLCLAAPAPPLDHAARLPAAADPNL